MDELGASPALGQAVRKVRPLRGHLCPLLPLLAWTVSLPLQALRALPERRSFMAAAPFFFFIIAVDLMSTANADLCIWRKGGGCSACSAQEPLRRTWTQGTGQDCHSCPRAGLAG